MLSFVNNIRLGVLHASLAITFVAINSVLNRIMINDMNIPATVVALMVISPYLLSPVQIWIGQYSDTHPILGYRRTPYIALGITLSMVGMMLTPHAALLMNRDFGPGFALGLVVFFIWGMGYNLSVVTYLSLASDLFEEQQRSRVIALMWVMMFIGIISSARLLGSSLEPYSDAQLIRSFRTAGMIGMGLIVLGLVGLEPRYQTVRLKKRYSQRVAIQAVITNPQARRFFLYLILLLAAILGQDLLLEPFGARAFGLNIEQSTMLTAIWGSATLFSLLLYGLALSRWMSKKTGAMLGATLAALGMLLIAVSGMLQMPFIFFPGIVMLGLGTGIATTTNLALMLDMTTPERAGLFIGAWGVADALARGTGYLLGGVGRDVITLVSSNPLGGYISVYLIDALILCCSLLLLRSIDVKAFREEQEQPSLTQVMAVAGDM